MAATHPTAIAAASGPVLNRRHLVAALAVAALIVIALTVGLVVGQRQGRASLGDCVDPPGPGIICSG